MLPKIEIKYDMEDFYYDVCLFNEIAGKSKAETKQDLLNQIKLIEEEVAETRAAIEQDNPVEILDGAVDVGVVLFGLMQQLENLGYRVKEAASVTCDNNLSKFPADAKVAHNTVWHLVETADAGEYRCEFSTVGNVWVIKDQNNKVRKPLGYVKNDLKEFVPQ
jgi:hypothetical protein